MDSFPFASFLCNFFFFSLSLRRPLKHGIKWPWIGQAFHHGANSKRAPFRASKQEVRRKKGTIVWFRPGPPFSPLLYANWLSRVYSLQVRLFFIRFLFSLQPLFLRLHLLARVINDLTDTLDEQCCESVKQVVIKTDAVFLWGRVRGDKERKREEMRREGKQTESESRKERKKGKVKLIIQNECV